MSVKTRFFIVFHGLLLLTATLFLMNFPVLFNKEAELYKYVSFARNAKQVRPLSNFLIINTAGDLELGTDTSGAKLSMVKRKSLINIFSIIEKAELNRNQLGAIVVYPL